MSISAKSLIVLLQAAVLFVHVSDSVLGDEWLSPPFMVFVNTYDWRPERQADKNELAASVAPNADLKLPSREELVKPDPRGVPFRRTGVSFTHGSVYCLTRDGETRKVPFHTIGTEKEFREFIDREVARRGSSSTRVDYQGLSVKLSSPPPIRDPAGPKSKPLVSWLDSYWAWQNGIMVFGHRPYVHSVSLAGLEPHVRAARDRDYYLYVEPSRIPKVVRESLLAQCAAWLGVRMQQRDDEAKFAVAVREALGEQGLRLAESFLMEDTRFSGSVQLPDLTNAGHGSAELSCRPDSELARFIRELSSGRRGLSAVPEDARMSVMINASLPKAVRDALKAMLAGSRLRGTDLGNALSITVDDGVLRAAAWLGSERKHAVISGVALSSVDSIDATKLASATGGHVDEAGVCVIPFNIGIASESPTPHLLTVVADNNQIRLSVPFGGMVGGKQDDQKDDDTQKPLSTALLKVDVNLGHLEDDSSNQMIDMFCRQAEQWYLKWRLGQMSGGMKRMEFGTESPNISVTSLAGNQRVGDYTFSATLTSTSDGTRIRADFRIGKELYGLLLARHWLTGQDIWGASRFRKLSR